MMQSLLQRLGAPPPPEWAGRVHHRFGPPGRHFRRDRDILNRTCRGRANGWIMAQELTANARPASRLAGFAAGSAAAGDSGGGGRAADVA